jgi:hypothetical protein
MRNHRSTLLWVLGLAALTGGGVLVHIATSSSAPDIAAIEREVAQIRGRPLKQSVALNYVTHEEALADLQAQFAAKEPLPAHYGKIVGMLGLHKGAEIVDVNAMRKKLLVSKGVHGFGFYDSDRHAMFIERNAPEWALALLYPHEIYHGFQDQYFDLGSYYGDRFADGSLNADELLARRAVVEGEATYVQMLVHTMRATGQTPTRQMVAPMIRVQSELDRDAMTAMLQREDLAEPYRQRIQGHLDATRGVPAFLTDLFDDAYRNGMAFVYAVHERGWKEVEKLYAEYPPASTEQILHPEKWFSREEPTRIEWATFDTNPLFAGWERLDQDVLGEARWRVVFREYGLRTDAMAAASGWDGDDYAIFMREADEALLLLWHTSWDTNADAVEFASAYRRLLEVKYADKPWPTRVQESGRNVFIVEGAEEASIDVLLEFVVTHRGKR